MPAEVPQRPLNTLIAAAALTLASGFVDTFGFLMLGGVFTSHVTGNAVFIGIFAFVQQAKMALHLFAVGTFVVGLLIGGVAVEVGSRRAPRRGFVLAMAIEAALLSLLFASMLLHRPDGGPLRFVQVALAAVAMGVQNTSLRMAGILGEYTTHLTGTITKLSEHAIAGLLGRRADGSRADRGAEAGTALFCLGLWCGFVAGALVAGALGSSQARILGLLIPIAIVIGVAAADLVSPFPRPEPRPMRADLHS